MVHAFYDMYANFGTHARYYVEANMLQEVLFRDEFETVGKERGCLLPIRKDKRKKPNKRIRIENLTPYFERGNIRFNAAIRRSSDMQELANQFLSFPAGHDDGPDACEGAVSYLHQSSGEPSQIRTGRYRRRTR